MRFTYLRLKGYVGIYQGCQLKELYIDFTKCKNRICIIRGKNGGGKSTLNQALNIYPDSNDMFIIGEEASKEIGVIDQGILYEIRCEHPVNKDGSRGQARAYIRKSNSENGFTELNTVGTIKSFKDIIEAEFGLDPNFIALSSLSTEDKGLVDKTPTERKKFVNNIVSGVEIYNNINKTLTKRNSINKGLINNLVAKIESIGNEESLKSKSISISNRIIELENRKTVINQSISEADSTIKILDPDLAIQTQNESIRIELEAIDGQLNALLSELETILTNNRLNPKDFTSIDQCTTLYAELKNKIHNLSDKSLDLEKKLSDILVDREEESRSLTAKIQRLNSLKSDSNFDDLEKYIAEYRKAIASYEEIFKQANIRNAANITKDEYILGLNTLKDIKDIIDNFRSYSFKHIIDRAADYISSNTNVAQKLDELKLQIKSLEKYLADAKGEYEYYRGLADKDKLLNDRPDNCEIDDCPFIANLLKARALKPTERLKTLEREIKIMSDDLNNMLEEEKTLEECILAVNDIKIILRSINNNMSIIKKLPIGYIFTNTNEVLERIKSGDQFEEILQMYKYINIANTFEEYKRDSDILKSLEADYKIYESKVEIIKELDEDVANIERKLSTIISDIDTINTAIRDNNLTIEASRKELDIVDQILVILRKVQDLKTKRDEYHSKQNTISTNMSRISEALNAKNIAEVSLLEVNKELNPLKAEKDEINYSLKMLSSYNEELAQIKDSYNLIEVIKKYSTPSKKGIQNIFIKVYMNQSLNLANQILSMFFNGKLLLTNFIIGEEGFSIPAVSMNTGMPVDDIKSCSRSEKAMASLALSAAMFKQASTHYNIFRLDEIDEGLDSNNRLMYIDALNTLLDILEVEQCIMISHSSELSLANVDVIKLRTDNDTVIGNEGNIIFNLS